LNRLWLTYQILDSGYETVVTLYRANLTNYEVKFSINSILNDGIEKKSNEEKRHKTIRVNLQNS